jgi:3-ketoacyl-CoA synthase
MYCSWHLSRSKLRELIVLSKSFEPECIEFQDKIAYRTGLGDCTAVPPAVQTADSKNCGIDAARYEYNETCFLAVKEVLEKTGINPRQVNFVITNSSLFNPTPSLSAAIINHFRMPSSTINYSLGGMGCSAGVIALDLARELLGNHPNSIALVVSHENITMSYYTGAGCRLLGWVCADRCAALACVSFRWCDVHG